MFGDTPVLKTWLDPKTSSGSESPLGPSRKSALPLGPITTLEEAEVLIGRALEALGEARSCIANLQSELEGTSNTIQRRMSSLRTVANQLERESLSWPQYCRSSSALGQAGVDSTLPATAPAGSVVEQLAERRL